MTTTDLVSFCTYEDSVFIDVGAPFSISVTPDTAICDVAGIQLWATPSSGTGHTWAWTPAATLSAGWVENPVATPAVTTEYFVTVTTGQGCMATDSVTITVAGALGLNVVASDVQLCQGETSQLNAIIVGSTLNLAYSWTPAIYLNDATIDDPVAMPLVPFMFICTVTDTVSGCSLVDSIFIDVNTLYQATATEDTVICSAFFFQLDVQHNVPAPFSISWTPAANLDDATIATPFILVDTTQQYVVQVSDAVGCSAFDTVNVTVPFSSLVFIPDSSLCFGDNAVLDAGFPGSTYLWITGETTQTIVVDTAGDYSVTITDAVTTCTTSFTTTITVDPLPVVILGADTSLCVGQNWALNAGNPGSVYVWSTTAATQQITVTVDGNYWVAVTDANSCINSDTIDIVFDPLPVIDLQDTTVCISETILLDAENPGSWYVWSTSEGTQVIAVNNISGTYSVVVTTATWCVDSADAVIDFIAFPVVDLGPDTALCDEEQITLDAGNPGMAFTWHTGAGTQTITLVDDVMAWVDVYNGYCITRDSVDVVFNPLPIEFLTPLVTICLDYPPHYAVLDAGNSDCTFDWSNGELTQVILAGNYGVYTVHITTPLNCSIDDEVLVQEYCQSAIYVPNVFTPDGDGINEFFFPVGHNLSTTELSIFDRWGELIHTGKDAAAFWDAKANGTAVQDGVYVWKVKYRFYENAEHTVQSPEFEKVGHVTVLR